MWLEGRFGGLFSRTTSIARLARFTADLLEAGLSVPDALRIAGFSVNRRRVRSAAWRLADDLQSQRERVNESYQRTLTATVVHAASSPMPTTSRIHLLREISACHASRSQLALSWTTGMIAPIAICVVGALVGVTVLALFLPLVKLVEGLAR
jgi:type IV pilus assembly protein PilC